MNWITNFFKEHKALFISIIAIILIANLLCYYLPDCCKSEIIGGLFILAAALITALFAIDKYQREQRTSRIQKIFFEDALINQVKILERMIADSRKNMLQAENIMSLISFYKDKNQITDQKKYLLGKFEKCICEIESNAVFSDFKKEIIVNWLHKSYRLLQWLDMTEINIARFNYFIKNQLELIYNKLSNNELEKLDLTDINKFINNNYELICRGAILLKLFAQLLLEFASLNFADIDRIKKYPQISVKCINILNNIDESFKILYGFYRDKDDINVIYTYAVDENGYRFRIDCKSKKADRIVKNITNENPIVFNDDFELAEIYIEYDKKEFTLTWVLIGLANKKIMKKKPPFLNKEDKLC